MSNPIVTIEMENGGVIRAEPVSYTHLVGTHFVRPCIRIFAVSDSVLLHILAALSKRGTR